MEYLILMLALLAVGALLFANGLWNDRKMKVWRRKKFQEDFGKRADRIYEDGEFQGISGYYRNHSSDFFIDDITWNDLDMDEIFRQMNTTESSAGQEYLYALLRSPSFDETELAERERLISYFSERETERIRFQMLFHEMGRTRKYSIYDYLELLETMGRRSSGRLIFIDVLMVLSVCFIGVSASVGLVAFICLLAFNICTYEKQKKEIEPYLITFKYVFRTVNAAEKFCRIKCSATQEAQRKVKALLPKFGPLKRSGFFGMRGAGDGSNPAEFVIAYLNIMFHFDILLFNRMLHQVRDVKEEIDAVLTELGRIDGLIAVAGYRKSLPGYCVPKLAEYMEADECWMEAHSLYHPLLLKPVKNDITAGRGVLLTGSNASGKSTFLKAAAINALFSQTIHACCADFYQGCFVRVMSSMALRDDLGSGESYYIVEIRALKRILEAIEQKGAPVLCFVDEVLRGTNTVERIAASARILKSLNQKGVCCFAATHDIELTQLLEAEYDNYHFEEEILENDIHFPYRLMEGRASTRNAIRLLSVMGYEEQITVDAEHMAEEFLRSGIWQWK